MQHCLAGERVATVVQAHVLEPGALAYERPEMEFAGSGSRGTARRGKDVRTDAAGLPQQDTLGFGVEEHRSWPGLAVAEAERVAVDLIPAEVQDLAAPAAGQEQEPDDVGLGGPRRALPFAGRERLVQPSDFFRTEEARAPLSGVGPHGRRGIAVQVPPPDRVTQDGPEQPQGVVGAAGCGRAVPIKPPVDSMWGDAFETQGPEGGQQLSAEIGFHALATGGLVPVAKDRAPDGFDEVAKPRAGVAVATPRECGGTGGGLQFQAGTPSLGNRPLRGGSERVSPRDGVRAGTALKDVGPPARGPDADAEAGGPGVPDGVLGQFALQPRDRGVGKPHASGHGSGPTGEDAGDRLDGGAGVRIGEVGVLQRRGGLAMTE